ncbi:iron donor protein CyaY [Rhinocladiella mackenziei CBS 650.93]|uniref:ferroxidase n=1 Tax=Rhinocladiella mackenziei CBS 650.93 TaxID=1442369 RepID=A0A0D2J0D0_9EURO|nr:iron donor protein CyaY [Rhinocladiella mackenziei CBS 650.93]KIX09091.1 iron donor protein CyaY [Rhinocladiella mackenziei CBS 650.93]
MKANTLLSRNSRAITLTFAHRPPPSSTSLYTRPLVPTSILRTSRCSPQTFFSSQNASFSTSPRTFKGLQPDSAEPAPPNTEPMSGSGNAAQISDAKYHELADEYLNTMLLALEELSETSNDGIEVEYAAGVLTITHPKSGTYVINKQPPNKQIWLSSPVSGPKRYDWVVSGAGQHEKEGSAVGSGDDGAGGRWIYLRDGSGLSELLKKEIGLELPNGSEV